MAQKCLRVTTRHLIPRVSPQRQAHVGEFHARGMHFGQAEEKQWRSTN